MKATDAYDYAWTHAARNPDGSVVPWKDAEPPTSEDDGDES